MIESGVLQAPLFLGGGTGLAHERDWLIALRAGLVGQSLAKAVQALGGVSELCSASRGDLRRAGLEQAQIDAIHRPDQALLDSDLAWLANPDHHLVSIDHDLYPSLLRQISSPPTTLFVVGDPAVLWQPQIGIVGSRNPTAGGLDNARAFSAELSRQGLTVTSGLARGIDSATHAAAIEAGAQTIAVMGTGPDLVYPQGSRRIAERIRGHGALVTELPPGTPAKRQHFPSRNRIISGLSLGVLVIEAGLNSGSLITARLAAEQGREAFALPGSLHNPLAKGCHRLIKQGARLVESTRDVIGELAPLAQELAESLRNELAPSVQAPAEQHVSAPGQLLEDDQYTRLWEAIGHDPAPVDDLISRSGLEAREVSSMLLMLELRGMVEFQPGGRVARRA